MKNRDDASYYHIATVVDDAAVKTLQSREFLRPTRPRPARWPPAARSR